MEYVTNLFISANELTKPAVSISVSFITLEHAKEYDLIKSLERVRLCDTLSVYFPALDVTVNNVKCVKTVFNVLLQKYDSLELGDVQTYLADTISEHGVALTKSVTKDEFQNEMAKIVSVSV